MGTNDTAARHLSRRHLDTLIEAVSSIDEDLSLPLLRTLLTVARHPALSVNELAEKMGVPQQTASRYVAILQGRYETLGKSDMAFAKAPLIALDVSSEDPRKRALSLTPDGYGRLGAIIQKFYRLK